MPLDPRISLASNPTLPDFGRMMDLGGGIMELQQKRQEMQGQNALKQVFADPASIDPATGSPTPNALRQIMQADPKTGMQFQQNMLRTQQQQLQTQMLGTKLGQQKLEMTTDANAGALEVYDKAIADGKTPEQAQELGQQALTDGMGRIISSGLFSQTEIPLLQTKFDVPRSRSYVAGSLEWRQRQAADSAATRAAAAEAETVRHHHVLEGKGDEDERRKGWEVMTDPTQKDAAGNPVQFRYNKQTGESTSLDMKPFTPGGAAKIGKAEDATGLLDDTTVDEMAAQFIAGDKSVFANLGRGSQGSKNIARVRGRIAQQMAEKGMTGADMAAKIAEFSGIMAGERTLGARTANIGMAVSEAKMMAPLALQASDKVDRSRFPTLNSVLVAGERGTGGEEVVRLGIATNSLINIYARAISPTGVPTVSDKDHARELLSSSWSKGQYRAGVDQLMMELNAASKAPGTVRQEFRDAVHEGNAPVSSAIPTVEPSSGAQAASGQPKPQEFPGLPDPAVAKLRAEPNLAADFDRKYGAGAAKRVLGGT